MGISLVSVRLQKILLGINAMSDVVDFAEGALSERATLAKTQYSGEKPITEEELAILQDTWVEEHLRVTHLFPQTMRRALFLTLYSQFEHDLEMISQAYQRDGGFTLAPSEVAGQGIVRSATYLKKIANVNFPDSYSGWTTIRRMGELRNAIAHAGGFVRRERKTLFDFVTTHPLLALDYAQDVVLQDGYMRDVIDVYHEFWVKFALRNA